jgi:hypothetical protein
MVLIIFSLYYILPGVQKIEENKTNALQVFENYNALKKSGVPFDWIIPLLAQMPDRKELLKIIQSAPEETKKVIVNTGSEDYVSWLQVNLWNTDAEKKSLREAKQKINSILPTMSPISNYSDEDNITLKDYIRFVENKILKTFGIENNMSLGIQWVAYGDATNKIPKNIGTFWISLDFSTTNANIQRLIEFIGQSWNPDILESSGTLIDNQAPKTMSNPLMTIDSFSLQNTISSGRPNDMNVGRMQIRFYIRGSSLDDIVFLKDNLKTRRETLTADIEKSLEECKKNEALCSQLAQLQQFQKKFLEFTRSIDARSSVVSSGDEIYVVTQQMNSLKSLEQEFSILVPNLQK